MEQTLDTELAVMQPSDNTQLSLALNNIEDQLYQAAHANTLSLMNPSDYTQAEMDAYTAVEELRLTKGLDLAAIMLRVKIIKDIENRALWSEHPNHTQWTADGAASTMANLARSVGISKTQLINERVMVDVVFPYFADHLNIQPAELFESMCRSNLIDILPVLRRIITGLPSPSADINATAARLVNNAAATMISAAQTNGLPVPTEEEINNAALFGLAEDASVLTNPEVRATVHPSAVTPIDPMIAMHDGRRFIVAEMTEDQWLTLQRKTGAFLGTPSYVNENVGDTQILRTLNGQHGCRGCRVAPIWYNNVQRPIIL